MKGKLELEQPVTWQTAQIWWDAMKSAEFETFPCHFPIRVFRWWKVTEISCHLISDCILRAVQGICFKIKGPMLSQSLI